MGAIITHHKQHSQALTAGLMWPFVNSSGEQCDMVPAVKQEWHGSARNTHTVCQHRMSAGGCIAAPMQQWL